MDSDVVIIGAGIIGLSTAYQLSSLMPNLKIIVLEKEIAPALHQSGRNSGVIHSGVYYKPDSLKAKLCISSRKQLLSFCKRYQIQYEQCGKIIVATENEELLQLEKILKRGSENGIACRYLSKNELYAREPHVNSACAIFVEDAGIIDFSLVCKALAGLVEEMGGKIFYSTPVHTIEPESNCLLIGSGSNTIKTRRLINCAGLFSDIVTRKCGISPPIRVVPFRGEYYKLRAGVRDFCQHLIYPVPDPRFPFLGVHLTRTIYGDVECGPNAVLALAREGYSWSDISIPDILDISSYPGFWRLTAKHWKTGVSECLRSVSKKRFCSSLQKLVPSIRESNLVRTKSGVRAQAVFKSGLLADDFIIEEGVHSIHVLNAPSPAATSSLAIGSYIANLQRQHL